MICRRAAALFDSGKECGADPNMEKLLAAETTTQSYGGFARREARLYQTAPISTNVILS